MTSMDLQTYYDQLFEESAPIIEQGIHPVDPLAGRQDTRFGLTLRIVPPSAVKEPIMLFLRDLQQRDSQQYYYPPSDIHFTLLSVLSCEENFRLDTVDVAAYVGLIDKVLKNERAFVMKVNGITASPACILLQGFPEHDMLNAIRQRLRLAFGQSSLKQSIDQRYTLHTAHSTVVRFRHPVSDGPDLLHVLRKHRGVNFGAFSVTEIELVYNDWYHRQVTILHRFQLLETINSDDGL